MTELINSIIMLVLQGSAAILLIAVMHQMRIGSGYSRRKKKFFLSASTGAIIVLNIASLIYGLNSSMGPLYGVPILVLVVLGASLTLFGKDYLNGSA